MNALQIWHAELVAGERTTAQWDALFFAAQQVAADEEFERETAAPHRAYLAMVRARGKRTRPSRPAKWERDAERMTAGIYDGA